MTYTLAVWKGDPPTDDEHATQIFEGLLDRWDDDDTPPTPGIREYVETLLAKWPDIGDERGVDSPWGDGPLMNNATGNLFHFSLVYSQAASAAPYCAELAKARGLVCFDPQEEWLL